MTHTGQTGVYFPSLDGNHRLLGTLFLAKGDAPKPTVILLHGMPGIEKNYDLALFLREQGWNTLLFHYQGCWGSGGTYTLKTMPDDVVAAINYLWSGIHPQVAREKIVLVGHSMGGWAALLAASHDTRVKAIAALGAVCNPQTIDWGDWVQTEFTPWLPGLSNDAFNAQWSALDDVFTPTAQVHQIKVPLLVIHAEQDEVVPAQQARDLVAKAHLTTRLILHPETNHSFTWHRKWLIMTIWKWLNELDL